MKTARERFHTIYGCALVVLALWTPAPLHAGIETEYVFNRGYLLYSLCKAVEFQKEYSVSLVTTRDDHAGKIVARLREHIAREYGTDDYFTVFARHERSSRYAGNPYSNYQRSMSPGGIDLFGSLMYPDGVAPADTYLFIIRELLNDPAVTALLGELEKYIGTAILPVYGERVNRLIRELGIDGRSHEPFRKVTIHYSAASFGETGGLYTSRNRTITIPDITDYPVFVNEFLHAFSFDLIQYDKRYNALAADRFWLNFNRKMDVVLFPYSPFELIDNYLALIMCRREDVKVSISAPYLQLFYNSFTPYLSKHFMGDLYGSFDAAYSASANYYDFTEKALKIYSGYMDSDAEKAVYSPETGIGDFLRGISGEVFLADGDIRRNRETMIRALCGQLSREYGARFIPVRLYDDVRFGAISELQSAISKTKTILLLPRKAFLDFIDSTFISVPPPERVNPSAKNLQNLCRLYYLVKGNAEVDRALITYFGVLIAICDDYRQLPGLLSSGMKAGAVYIPRR
ncbi:MAG: hypothetical protein EPN93_21230 [Spirochaetes bacterium]|nr:MAG: hypothetical protein EPN93_21230 [Spirochaetota bacterium]